MAFSKSSRLINGVHIWGVCGQWKNEDVLIYKKFSCTCCSMRHDVVMHQHPKVLMNEWNSQGAQYVICITWAFRLPLTTTRFVFLPPVMPPQNRSRLRTQRASNLSPFLRYTRIRLSAKFNLKRDSSVKSTLTDRARVQRKWCRAERKGKLRLRLVMIWQMYCQ